jgi:hypothetical protein
MERYNLAEIYAEVKPLFNEFAQMWQGWGITAETVYEGEHEGLWLLKYEGNVLRPLSISIAPNSPDDKKLPWVALKSNEKVNFLEGHKGNRRYLHSYFERLTEYLVVEAAQAPAIEKSKLYVQKHGKHLRLNLPAKDGLFWFSFYLRRKGWTWIVWRWIDPHGWVVMDRVYRPFNENPIKTFVAIIDHIGLALL